MIVEAKLSIFDAELPTLTYDITAAPQQIYPEFRAAQQQAPIALGPVGPEVLSYELALRMANPRASSNLRRGNRC